MSADSPASLEAEAGSQAPPSAEERAWLRAVGRVFAKPGGEREVAGDEPTRDELLQSLGHATADGIQVAPLYTRRDEQPQAQARFPGGGDALRGSLPNGSPCLAYQWIDPPAKAEAVTWLKEAANGGVAGIVLRLHASIRQEGRDPEDDRRDAQQDARQGAPRDDQATSGAVPGGDSEGVLLHHVRHVGDLLAAWPRGSGDRSAAPAPVLVEGGAAFLPAALLFLAAQRSFDPFAGNPLEGSWGADPLGSALRGEALPGGFAAALRQATALDRFACARPLRTFLVDGLPLAAAGASDAQELGWLLSAGVFYLRALERPGDGGLAEAAARLSFRLGLEAHPFQGVAKLRAFRGLWQRVLQACAVPQAGSTLQLWATLNPSLLSAQDAWVNLLRSTTASFSAALGGAQGVMLPAFDGALATTMPAYQPASELGRRLTRNIPLVLREEARLEQVIDPVGGSWYVEHLTEALAEAGWRRFQELEALGGAWSALRAGRIHRWCEATRTQWHEQLARGEVSITGVTSFPPAEERLPPLPERRSPQRFWEEARRELEQARSQDDADRRSAAALAARGAPPEANLAALLAWAEAGASLGELQQALHPPLHPLGAPRSEDRLPPLPCWRRAEAAASQPS